MTALIGWICDNQFCQTLRNLTVLGVRIPYLQYHAVLWHGGTCIGIHYIYLVLMAQRIVFQYGLRPRCINVAGIVPYLTVDEKRTRTKI